MFLSSTKVDQLVHLHISNVSEMSSTLSNFNSIFGLGFQNNQSKLVLKILAVFLSYFVFCENFSDVKVHIKYDKVADMVADM